jgi:bile acid:Na+ symporter, BASS family
MSYFLQTAIGLIMFGIGMNILPKHFKRVFLKPKGIITGLFAQLVLLPLLGFLIAISFPMEPVFQVGIMLIAACPGGTSSNLITYLLNGRVALSVSITAFNSLLIIITIPLILQFATDNFLQTEETVQLSFVTTFFEILYTVIIPVLLGMQFRLRFIRLAFKIRPLLKFILPGILLTLFTLVIFTEETNGGSLSMSSHVGLFLPAIILNIGAMLIGYLTARIVGIKHTGRYTIAIEMGLQNSALAIFIANSMLKIDGIATMAVIYGSFTFFTTFLIAWLMKRSGQSEDWLH